MSVDDLAERAVKSVLLERPYNGVILDNATAHNHPVRVTVPDFDPLRSFGPLLWPSMVTSEGVPLLPQQGDEALVLFDQDQQPWIARWRGGVEDPAYIVEASLAALDTRLDALEATPAWATVSYGANWRRYQNLVAEEVQVAVEPGGKFALARGRVERITSAYAVPSTLFTVPANCFPTRSQIFWPVMNQSAHVNDLNVRVVVGTNGVAQVDDANTAGMTALAIGDLIYCDGLRWPLF